MQERTPAPPNKIWGFQLLVLYTLGETPELFDELYRSNGIKKEVYALMNSYPNQGDPNQPEQYPPGQEQAGAQHGGGYQTPPSVPPPYGEPPPYQQGAYQPPPYQAPYQAPYAQSPYPQRQSSIAVDWRYLTAGIGALLSLILFFIPSYNEAIALVPIANSQGYYAGLTSAYSSAPLVSGAQLGRQLWLDLMVVLVALIIVLLLQFGNQLFKAPTSPIIQRLVNSLNTSSRTWGLALLVVGAFGIFFHFILDLGVLSFWGVGAWLYLLGLIAVVVGGFFIYKPPSSTLIQVPTVR